MENRTSQSFRPISHKFVSISDDFWSPRLKINRDFTIPYEYNQCKNTGRLDAFRLNWTPDQSPPHIFWDSDVAKWIEAVSYSLCQYPDPDLEALADDAIELIANAQQPDGYLNIYYTVVKPEDRWTDLEGGHELYCAGHMIEAAVAYFDATGKRRLLDVVCRYVDYIDSVFGSEQGKIRGYPGHEEIELALVKLYRTTKEERYLRLSQFFINERGQGSNYFDKERSKREGSGFLDPVLEQINEFQEYNQSHNPVREQDKVVGHAVRAMYLYTAMADLADELGDETLLNACERLWNNMVNKRMYITGGIGPSEKNEGFTYDYDLPKETSYAETCASIGSVFWNHRMVQFDCDGRYSDLLERTLYNAVIAGVSLDGEKFFYNNPLQSNGDVHREEWFDVACCPPNIARLLASLGQYIYSQSDQDVAVHLYVQSKSSLNVNGTSLTLQQQTNYPWEPNISFSMNLDSPTSFGLRLRIPAWCDEYSVLVNGQEYQVTESDIDKGYLRLERLWRNGDIVELNLSMPVKRIYANSNVRQCAGKVALQRGPLVYCIEQADNTLPVTSMFLPENRTLMVDFERDLLNGVSAVSGEALAGVSPKNASLYGFEKPEMKSCYFKAIPYYAWDNREPGSMMVWIHEYQGSESE